jgi:hypothetical protein
MANWSSCRVRFPGGVYSPTGVAAPDPPKSSWSFPEAVQGNRITAGRLQLRLGRDLRWYPYVRSGQDWEPSGSPDADPALVIADL